MIVCEAYKGEWKLVMENVSKVGSVIASLGNIYHGLEAEELSSDLFAMFEPFQRCLVLLLNSHGLIQIKCLVWDSRGAEKMR